MNKPMIAVPEKGADVTRWGQEIPVILEAHIEDNSRCSITVSYNDPISGSEREYSIVFHPESNEVSLHYRD